jgi:nitrate reductase gamma subunit
VSDHALFAAAPGLALLSLGAVSVLRYLLVRQRGPLDRSALVRTKRLLWGSWTWRVGLCGLMALHLLLLIFPHRVLVWNQRHWRLLLLEGTGLLLGLAALVGIFGLIVRNIRSPGRTSPADPSMVDAAFLGLLLVSTVSGLATAVLYRWASSWSTLILVPYVRGLAGLEARVGLVGGLPYVVKLHVFSAIVLLGILPFTSLFLAALYPLDRALSAARAPLAERARRGRVLIEAWARRGVTALSLNREED